MARSRTHAKKNTSGQSGQFEYQFYSWDLPRAAKRVAEGLSTNSLTTVQRRLKLSNSEFARVISVSPRTLTHRRKEERLPPEESERVYRVGRLAEMAARVLGNEEEAQESPMCVCDGSIRTCSCCTTGGVPTGLG